MSDMTYAVHTATCSYLLDDDGVCRWTLSPTGQRAPGTERVVGAQFVACLDLLTPGGLVGELAVGAAALFARSENGRLVLLRTTPIERVEYRADPAPLGASPEPTVVLPAGYPPQGPTDTVRLPAGYPMPSRPSHASRSAPMPPTEPLPRVQVAYDADVEELDSEDLMSISVTEVTVTLPHARAAAGRALPSPAAPRPAPRPPDGDGPPTRPGAPHAPPRRGVTGPGRRIG
jgi:hypothetical protein